MSVAPTVDERRVVAQERRRSRLDARYALWQMSSIGRVRACGRFLHDVDGGKRGGDGYAVVKASGSVADGTRSAGVGGVQSCGSVWTCPMCAERIQAERQAQVATALAVVRLRGWETLFVTLTMRHKRAHRLGFLWDQLSDAWRYTTSGSPGVPYIGKRGRQCKGSKGDEWARDKFEFGIQGYLRLVEVTHGSNGWHVHVHALVIVNPWQADPAHTWRNAAGAPMLTDAGVDVLGARLFGRWRDALALAGKGITPGERHGVDVKRVRADDEISRYFAKNVYDRKGEGSTAHDVTGSHSKMTKNGNRSPFGILAGLVTVESGVLPDHLDADHDFEQDKALWQAFEQASAGRRQLVWSNGIKAELGLDEDRTDQEIVDEAPGGETLEHLTKEEWTHISKRRMQAALLEAAEADDTGEALCAFLNLRVRPKIPDL